MIKLLREPLLHFLLIGVGLFCVYQWVNETESEESPQQIVVTAGRIRQLRAVFQKTWRRPPTDEELHGLIDEFILEEAYYRQAITLGIDRDDTIIRRRLQQKLEFLTDDIAALVAPTDEELALYLAEHPHEFREPPSYTFDQMFFDSETHGDTPATYVANQLVALRSGKQVKGDASLLVQSLDKALPHSVDGTFGKGFARKLDKLAIGDWQGPVSSEFGFHLIRLQKRTAGRVPELNTIRPAVKREWSNAKRIENRQKVNARLRGSYKITIEWPEEQAADKSTSDGESP